MVTEDSLKMQDITTPLPEFRCTAAMKRAAPESGTKSPWHSRARTSPIRITGSRPKARKSHAAADEEPSCANGCSKARGRCARRSSPAQGVAGAEVDEQPAPSRRPGSSIYYGVRYRLDLLKWVAEIRVAEWKAVDKKVWLGTFNTEDGAARAVDLARKLLKCQKRHGYNLPCPELDAYVGQIPPHLVLSDITATAMFKSATLFIKHECRAYAARFDQLVGSPATTTVGFITQASSMSPTFFDMTETESLDSELLDGQLNENSDSDDSLSISVDDYLYDHVVDYPFEATVSQFGASPSSCTSTMSCMTFEAQCSVEAAGQTWDQLSSGPSSLDAEFGDARCVMATSDMQGEVQCGMQGWVQGAVSQEDDQCWVGNQCTWPGTGSSSALAPLPGSYNCVDGAFPDHPLSIPPWF